MEAIQRLWTPIKVKEQTLKEMRSVLFIAVCLLALYFCAEDSVSSYESRVMLPEKGNMVTVSGVLSGLPEVREEYGKILMNIVVEKDMLSFPSGIIMPEDTSDAGKENMKPDRSAEDGDTVKYITDYVDSTSAESGVSDLTEKDPEIVPAVLTVHIYGNGGVPEASEKTYNVGEFTESMLENPRRLGKIFDGWYEDAACTIPFGGISKEQDTLTLYAGWKEFPGFVCNDKGHIIDCTGSWKAISDGILIIPEHKDCVGIAKGAFDKIREEIFEICIPPNIAYIAPGAFAALDNLVYIEVLPGNPVYDSEEGIVYDKSGNIAAYPAARMGME